MHHPFNSMRFAKLMDFIHESGLNKMADGGISTAQHRIFQPWRGVNSECAGESCRNVRITQGIAIDQTAVSDVQRRRRQNCGNILGITQA
jgi:hypothetical protein